MMSQEKLDVLEVITFDGDMTLWDFNTAMRQALSFTLQAIRQRFSFHESLDLTIDKMIEIRNATAADLKGNFVNLERIRFEAFRRTLLYLDREDDIFAAELNTLYFKHRFEDIKLYADVLPTLRILGSTYKLGLLSNGNNYPDRCGLPNIFTFTVFAQDVGVEKPDRRIFQKGCQLGSCTPDVVMHIGDSLINDVYGAKECGMVAVWLNRDGGQPDIDIIPDICIESLTELISILNVPI